MMFDEQRAMRQPNLLISRAICFIIAKGIGSIGSLTVRRAALADQRLGDRGEPSPRELACRCIHGCKHIATLFSLHLDRWLADTIRIVCRHSGAA